MLLKRMVDISPANACFLYILIPLMLFIALNIISKKLGYLN